MKGGVYGIQGKQLYLVLAALVFTTILIWAREKTSFLTSLVPLQTRALQLYPVAYGGALKGVNGSEKVGSVELEAPVDFSNTSSLMLEKEENATISKEDREIGSVELEAPVDFSNTSSLMLEKEENATISKEDREIAASIASEGKNNENKVVQDQVAPMNSADTVPFVVKEEHNNATNHVKGQACNYAKGKWITDDSWPLYSGFGCKQWLSAMWACRLTQRTDFAYEKLRWQPEDCELEQFTGSKFLGRMQNKTLAFIGDSLGRQQFQSLMCMVSGGEGRPDVLDVGKEYGLVKARGAVRPDGWAYRFPSTNTTILYYWSASLCDLVPIDVKNSSTDIAMHLDRPPAFLRHFLHRFDVLVLNTGHHWNRGKLAANRWVMHVGGVPNTDKKIADINAAKNLTMYSIVHWVNSQLHKYPELKAFYRSISPRHFFNGDWNTGGTCDNTVPLSGGKEVVQDKSSDPVAAGAVKGTKVKFLDITALSQLRDEGHISRYTIRATPGAQDCLHWCLPGVPDTWNDILFSQL